jgi:small subunit ribosomal protein S11
MKTTNTSKKKRRLVTVGVAHINATFNNTFITITDAQGEVISSSSAGANGFKGSKKSTPYAAQITAAKVIGKAKDFGLKTLSVEVSGPGTGRESAVRALQIPEITITSIRDVTPVAHNGCRPPKRRRV